MSVPKSDQSHPAGRLPAGDPLMLDVEFFDDKGHWNPRTVLFASTTHPERTSSLKVRLFGKVMQWRAAIWASEIAEKHLKEIPDCDQFLKNVKSNFAVDRKQFFDLLTEYSLRLPGKFSGNPASEGNAEKHTDLRFFRMLRNFKDDIFEGIRSKDWENLGESYFKQFSMAQAESLVHYIDLLKNSPANDQFIDRIEKFVSNYRCWSQKSSDGTVELNGGMISSLIESALTSYRPINWDATWDPVSKLHRNYPSQNSRDSLSALIQRKINAFRDDPNFKGSLLAELESSSLLSYLNSEPSAAAASISSNSTDVVLLEKLAKAGDKEWRKALEFLSDEQIGFFLSRMRVLEIELPTIQNYSEIRRMNYQAELARKNLISESPTAENSSLFKTLSQIDWNNEAVVIALTSRDVEKINSWIAKLDRNLATRDQCELIEKMFASVKNINLRGLSDSAAKYFLGNVRQPLVAAAKGFFSNDLPPIVADVSSNTQSFVVRGDEISRKIQAEIDSIGDAFNGKEKFLSLMFRSGFMRYVDSYGGENAYLCFKDQPFDFSQLENLMLIRQKDFFRHLDFLLPQEIYSIEKIRLALIEDLPKIRALSQRIVSATVERGSENGIVSELSTTEIFARQRNAIDDQLKESIDSDRPTDPYFFENFNWTEFVLSDQFSHEDIVRIKTLIDRLDVYSATRIASMLDALQRLFSAATEKFYSLDKSISDVSLRERFQRDLMREIFVRTEFLIGEIVYGKDFYPGDLDKPPKDDSTNTQVPAESAKKFTLADTESDSDSRDGQDS